MDCFCIKKFCGLLKNSIPALKFVVTALTCIMFYLMFCEGFRLSDNSSTLRVHWRMQNENTHTLTISILKLHRNTPSYQQQQLKKNKERNKHANHNGMEIIKLPNKGKQVARQCADRKGPSFINVGVAHLDEEPEGQR